MVINAFEDANLNMTKYFSILNRKTRHKQEKGSTDTFRR